MTENKSAGLFLGLACGDALGRPVEFNSAAQIKRDHGEVTEMIGGGTHHKDPGTITDDTELALCIAQSLVANNEFDPADVASRFVEWYESDPFDIGVMTSSALVRLKDGKNWDEAGEEVWTERPEGQNAGNGSIMRCAPYAIAYADNPDTLGEISRKSSTITHFDPRCAYGCEILNRTLAGLLREQTDPLKTALDAVEGDAPTELLNALQGLPEKTDPTVLESNGYVINTLQTGLYHGLTATDPRDGIVKAVNMGDDTDTVGAVTGAVVGARFGESELPDDWVSKLTVDDVWRGLPDWWPAPDAVPAKIRHYAGELYQSH